ncbi:hypothetical protein LTR56_025137 [Elasticomyces elasticus]|nr:hypothetical protein LTR56_025137 [Elasticomyces elasticus]KAK4904868.1 hypothetical protein LTR49_025759 [Elasticomyces elasticus]KAK5741022.1 hypothetical protein LTS12_024742 [Elasticomyces elasticus]
MYNEAKGLYRTAYRSYWADLNFRMYIPEKHDCVGNFHEDDLHHVRHVPLCITWEEMQMLLHDTGSPSSTVGTRKDSGVCILSMVMLFMVSVAKTITLSWSLVKMEMVCHDVVKPWARGDDFKPIEKKELDALFEHNLQLKVR